MRGNDPRSGLTPLWYPSGWLDAQLSHTGWGAFIILAGTLHVSLLAAVIGLMVWIVVKEWCFDLVVERDDFLSSTCDAAFWVVGGLVGWMFTLGLTCN